MGPMEGSGSGLPVNTSFTSRNYIVFASICLFYYDLLITLPTEIRVFWRCPLSLAGFFYFLTRYGFLVNMLLISIFNVRVTPTPQVATTAESCHIFYDIVLTINMLNFASVAAFVAARIYAIWGRNWRLGLFIFLLGLLNPNAVTPAFLLSPRFTIRPVWGCQSIVLEANDKALIFITRYLPVITSSIGIVYELLCLFLTAWKTVNIYKVQRANGIHSTLTSLLLRDGTLYFAVMTSLSIVNIVLASIPHAPTDVQINMVLGRTLTPILTTRFIAHLRQLDPDDAEAPCSVTSVEFQLPGNVGPFTSVGAPMSFGDYDDGEGGDEPMMIPLALLGNGPASTAAEGA